MTNFLTTFNVRWALAQRPVLGDLPPAVSTTGVALSLLLLATPVLLQGAAKRLVCINMQVQRFMAHWKLAGDLLWAPLQPKQRTGSLYHPGRKRAGVAARFRAFAGKFTSLFGSVASTPGIAAQLATDRGLVSYKLSGNLRDVLLDIHMAVNLISFILDEVFLIHRATSSCRSGSLKC
jgi:hypothetical protein